MGMLPSNGGTNQQSCDISVASSKNGATATKMFQLLLIGNIRSQLGRSGGSSGSINPWRYPGG